MHPACLPIEQLLRDCTERRTRGSGPGGQHRNKVETAIEIVHRPTQVSGAASERREQARNRKVAIQRLRVSLALAIRTPEPTEKISALWNQYAQSGRVKVNVENTEFPCLLADALDRVALAQGDVSGVAEKVGISTTQLVKFLRLEPVAWTLVANWRAQFGLRPLKPPT